MSTIRTNLLAGAAAIVVMVVAFLLLGGGSDEQNVVVSGDDSTVEGPTTEVPVTQTAEPDEAAVDETAVDETAVDDEADIGSPFSDLPLIEPADLPIEAIETLLLIADGGPYPYRQDDGVFQNREGILPERETGHYREYTVDTPGSDDRGARRIVAGADGELYYTDDHYDSFREIAP